jgi:hypothetical protein
MQALSHFYADSPRRSYHSEIKLQQPLLVFTPNLLKFEKTEL